MQKFWIGAAIAVAAYFGALALPATAAQAPAEAPFAIEEGVTQEYVAPRVLGVDDARLTQYQPDGQVDVPYGDVVAELLQTLLLAVGAFAAFLLRKLPATVVSALDSLSRMTLQKSANELLEHALAYGINTTANAARGRTLSLKVGNEVLERAFEYALRHAPGLVNKMGGLLQLREKIIARLDIDPADSFTAARAPIVEPLVVEPAPAQQ